MKHYSPFSAGIWPFLLLPLLILLPLLYFYWHAIEQDVSDSATQALATTHNWAKAETYNNGRDVLLIGTAPNSESISQAEQIASKASGVRIVKFIGELAPPSPFSLEIRKSSGKLILAGTVASQTAVDSLVNAAIAKHGSEYIINKLEIGGNIAEFESAEKLLVVTQLLPDSVSLSVLENEFYLRGSMESESSKAALKNQLSSVLISEIVNDLIVISPPLDGHAICQEYLNQLLGTAKINFDSGKASIKEDSHGLIQNVANTVNRCPDANFEVVGHTDSLGGEEFNIALSRRRAMAVVEAMMKLGLSADRFTISGFGANSALEDNTTAKGRAANRRIEFKIKN